MSTKPIYSSLFSTIHDEPGPVGNLGRGTHYSVLRCAEWFDVVRTPLQKAQIHDFAVIWDEDHDTRVFDAIERLYVSGLLSPVQFIGERKGSLTVLVAAKFYFHGPQSVIDEYKKRVEEISQTSGGDCWPSEVGMFDRAPGWPPHQTELEDIIADKELRVVTYLRHIDSLWSLGTKEYSRGISLRQSQNAARLPTPLPPGHPDSIA